MSLWNPFSWVKKRDPGDIAQARLLEHLKFNIESVRACLHKTSDYGRQEALREAQSALSLLSPSQDITNPKHVQENQDLKSDVESLVRSLREFEQRERGGGFITQKYKDSMKDLETRVQRIIGKINGLLGAI